MVQRQRSQMSRWPLLRTAARQRRSCDGYRCGSADTPVRFAAANAMPSYLIITRVYTLEMSNATLVAYKRRAAERISRGGCFVRVCDPLPARCQNSSALIVHIAHITHTFYSSDTGHHFAYFCYIASIQYTLSTTHSLFISRARPAHVSRPQPVPQPPVAPLVQTCCLR